MLVTSPTAAVPVTPKIDSPATTQPGELPQLRLSSEEKDQEVKPPKPPSSPKSKTQLDSMCTTKGIRLSNDAVLYAAHSYDCGYTYVGSCMLCVGRALGTNCREMTLGLFSLA